MKNENHREGAGAIEESREPFSLRDELLTFRGEATVEGSTCAVLTPAIRQKLRGMRSGQVLEVRVDDPSAKGDVEAWCRLSGNALLRVIETEGMEIRILIEKN
jgi:TusA-related sulfurtransferase